MKLWSFGKKTPPAETIPNNTKAEGQNYMYDYFDQENRWDDEKLTIEEIEKFKDHPLSDKIKDNITNMVLEKIVYNIADQKGGAREDVAEWVREVFSPLAMFNHISSMLHEWFEWGDFIQSKGIGQNADGQYVITELRVLPCETFTKMPFVTSPYNAYGKYLKGIVRFQDGSTHFYQYNNIIGIPEEIINCEHIKSPKNTAYIDGIPLLTPVYKQLPDYEFGRLALKQNINRENIWFLRHTDKNNLMPDNTQNVWQYIQSVLKSVSRNQFFGLPYNVEPVEVEGTASGNTLKTMEDWRKWILETYSPADFLSTGGENKLGGSTAGENELLQSFIAGLQRPIKEYLDTMINDMLAWNGYTDLRSDVNIIGLKLKNQDLDFQKGSKLIDAFAVNGVVLADPDEIREYFGLENADIEYLLKAKEKFETLRSNVIQPSTFSVTPVTPQLPEPNPNPQDKQMTEEEVQQDVKQNQGEPPSFDESVQKLESELSGGWEDLIKAVEKGL